MTKIYSKQAGLTNERQKITISETKTVTTKKQVSVWYLKKQYTRLKEQLQTIKISMNDLIDEMQDIHDDENLDITITEIPEKESIALKSI